MEDMQQLHEATYQNIGGGFDVYTGNI